MHLPTFKLEEYFAKHEFSAPYMLGSSDAETHNLSELLAMADVQCLHLWQNLKMSYTETHGLPLLREEISRLYTKQAPDNILVFSGAEEAIYITMRVLLQANDEVVVLTPCYQSLTDVAKAIGAKVIEFSLDWIGTAWGFDLARFKQTLTAKTKLVVINFPHNPTGFHPDKMMFNEIISSVKQWGIHLFSDEVYRLSEQNSRDTLPNAADCYDKALSLSVMSKAFGLPGLRIGWLAAQDKALLAQLANYKNYTTICNSAPSELLSVIALRNKQEILNRNIGIAKHNLALLDKFFSRHGAAYAWYRPKAGFVSFPRLKLAIDIVDYAEKFISEEGVIIAPGTLFNNFTNHFRLGFSRGNLPEVLERLERFTQNLIKMI